MFFFFQIRFIHQSTIQYSYQQTKKLDLCICFCLHINKARGKTNKIVMLQNLQKLCHCINKYQTMHIYHDCTYLEYVLKKQTSHTQATHELESVQELNFSFGIYSQFLHNVFSTSMVSTYADFWPMYRQWGTFALVESLVQSH